jgi:hypothetical protein
VSAEAEDWNERMNVVVVDEEKRRLREAGKSGIYSTEHMS